MSKVISAIVIALFLLSAVAIPLSSLSTAEAQTTRYKETYAFCIPIDNPVGVGQPCLLWIGITDMVAWPQDGWTGLTVTVTKPDGTTEELGPFKTDNTGGTGTEYTPNTAGIYYFVVHFPEQTKLYNRSSGEYGAPAGTVMRASDSEKASLTVTEEAQPVWPGIPLPTEYWTRPINAQFREWSSISGSYLYDELPTNMNVGDHFVIQDDNQAPETAHILWRRQAVSGGLVGGASGDLSFNDGTAYEGKFSAFVMAGVLYRNVAWPTYSQYQAVSAIDLRTGEELWFKEGIRASFCQLMYWDTFDMHGIFSYVWVVEGSTWKAYDGYTGELWYTMTNCPSFGSYTNYMQYGPKGEILIYQIDFNNGWISLWNSTAVERNYYINLYLPDPETYYWANRWRPYGLTIDASYGMQWNKTFPTGLPLDLDRPSTSLTKIRGDILIGSNLGQWQISDNPAKFWAVSLKPGQEGTLLWQKSYPVPGNLTWQFRDASAESDVFVVVAKETRQWIGFSVSTGEKLWGPTASQAWGDWVSWGQRNWIDVIAYDKLYSGSYGGIVYCYNVKTGELLWNYTIADEYAESLMGPNWEFGIYFLSDGKIYLGTFEHSSFNPMPRGSPSLCLNATTGELIWSISIRTGNFMGAGRGCLPVIGDGVMVIQNSYDMCDYAIAKGPSATTVEASPKTSVYGDNVVVEGMVTDISPGTNEAGLTMRFPNGVPAVSDESMSDWMQYVYMQFPRPQDAKGVDVVISVIDPNNNSYEVAKTTSDASGHFGCTFAPLVPGFYTVIATFEGSEAYYGSFAETSVNVEEAPAATAEPTASPASMADLYLVPGIIGIVVAIAVVGAILVLMLRKR